MLPKIWKKLLLAICIIACLFNITAKLVNRISLEKVIATEQEGVNVKEILNIVEEEPVLTNQKTTSTYNVVDDEQVVGDNYQEEIVDNQEANYNEEPVIENVEEQEKQNDFMTYITDTSKYTDFLQN